VNNRGVIYAITAYGIWGIFPVYWKWLHEVPAFQITNHRVVWSFVLLTGLLLVRKQWQTMRTLTTWHSCSRYAIAALLIAANWLIFIWAVNAGHVVEVSLGYFINPLLSVLIGVVVLRERLRPWEWVPIGIATIGVAYLTIWYGGLPWISLSLALTFALYAFVKKTAPLNPLYGMTLETGALMIPASAYLLFCQFNGSGAFLHESLRNDLLLIGCGIVSTAPLLLFASAAQRIPLSLIGVLQYITPILQFLLGVVVYNEPFSHHQLIGFSIIWLALFIFGAGNLLKQKMRTA
jgi:chloramphenicol-sensitive protein RarD